MNVLNFSQSFQFLDLSSNNSRNLPTGKQKRSLINSSILVSIIAHLEQTNHSMLDCFPTSCRTILCVCKITMWKITKCFGDLCPSHVLRRDPWGRAWVIVHHQGSRGCSLEMSCNLLVGCGERIRRGKKL